MTDKATELEVKFYLNNPKRFTNHLLASGAVVKTPRCHEYDLRFDDGKNSLQKTGKVLRLRQDWQITLTYKGPGEILADVSLRREIEVGVTSHENMLLLLESLGFHPVFSYEKYRTTYIFEECEIVLDEMPFGWFCEIEGPSPQSIRSAAEQLGLDWETRIVDSYAMLFRRCKENKELAVKDLLFANFTKLCIRPLDLGVLPGDGEKAL
ncbi:MAG: class IV adenylate cyclase [Anaerolineaceae bacterium]|nr:class IV adenylate cyclase [Anaerolineaceae bacterium]